MKGIYPCQGCGGTRTGTLRTVGGELEGAVTKTEGGSFRKGITTVSSHKVVESGYRRQETWEYVIKLSIFKNVVPVAS